MSGKSAGKLEQIDPSLSIRLSSYYNKSQFTSTGLMKHNFYESFPESQEPHYQPELFHFNCSCYHCINGTKPQQIQQYPRIKAEDQYTLEINTGYAFIINKLIDFPGNIKIPDTFMIDDSSLLYTNQKNKIKCKSNLTPSDIKKCFDSKRTIYNKIIKSQIQRQKIKKQTNSPNHSTKSISIGNYSSTSAAKNHLVANKGQSTLKQALNKQVAIIHFKTSLSQIVNEQLLNKLFLKRKNDVFWHQVNNISLIPPFKQKQLFYHQYNYVRTKKTIEQLEKIIENIGQLIDKDDNQEFNIHESQSLFDQIKEEPQTKKLNISDAILTNQQNQQNQIQLITKQIVSYIQIKHHYRILQCTFKYIIDDESNCYLCEIDHLILVELKKNELKMIHDRLKTLQQQGIQELVEHKIKNQKQQFQCLKSILAQVVKDCLQTRWIQLLKLNLAVQYRRLSTQELVQIFKRIFPTFNQHQVFSRQNWQNQFTIYLKKCKTKINQIIRQDEGIRILKRFQIIFFRTWNN